MCARGPFRRTRRATSTGNSLAIPIAVRNISDRNSDTTLSRAIPLYRFSQRAVVPTAVSSQLTYPEPRYPSDMQSDRISGFVDLQFVVDANGLVAPQSVRVLRATRREFIEASRQALVASKFRPARVGTCAVPQVLQQRFSYRSH